MRAVEIIDRKRRGGELSGGEISWLIEGYLKGEVADYQMSAWLMAVCCRGLTRGETFSLTSAMVSSGATLDLGGVGRPVADKHSSGGVGDKTTLVVAPLVRACGVAIGKMSGRGLGFTGGTIDKLESIPGFRVSMSASEFVHQLEQEGIVVAGQSPELAPADGKLYALRDVTATVQSTPLIASSIMSKKLAIGAQALVLDVKVGRGAFMESIEAARELADLMVEIGTMAGKRVSALISPMDQPLGYAVGNALEVREAMDTLAGRGPADLEALCVSLAAELLALAGTAANRNKGERTVRMALEQGEGLEWFRRLVEAQGGDPRVIDDPSRMGSAPIIEKMVAATGGEVVSVDARLVAQAALELGAGRARKEDSVDPQVGVVLHAKVGDTVALGEPVATIHARTGGGLDRALGTLRQAFVVAEDPGSMGDAFSQHRVQEWHRGSVSHPGTL